MRNISNTARIAANLARMYPSLGRDRVRQLAATYGIPASILTLARVLAQAERSGVTP